MVTISDGVVWVAGRAGFTHNRGAARAQTGQTGPQPLSQQTQGLDPHWSTLRTFLPVPTCQPRLGLTPPGEQGKVLLLPEAQLPPPQNGLMTRVPGDVQFNVMREVCSGHRTWHSRAPGGGSCHHYQHDVNPPRRGGTQGARESLFPDSRPGHSPSLLWTSPWA